ncbi:prepilin-type N-terminal cleavage/methylation domain-containing protein [Gilvimarinus polysaccharolyticus]|uniref:prepilin-type N-terminal cleavage/methylation domain-containing protein n=1 Tax=Gilvimarinus polysaccharolyticus TaxID=863921 RepID=UPI00067336D8|nr:prepilin-type N-terminal cleavage/methylation domain-containing protein [Gilvimarinus polysaccharolyticus]
MTSKTRGFTLIELVVSIAILSLIVLATVTAMRTLANTQARLEQKAEASSQMQLVSNYLRQALSDAKPVTMLELGVPSGVYFYGNESYLQFVAPLAISGRAGGLWSLRLALQEGQLMAQYQPGLQLAEWTDSDLSYVLLSDVEEFAVAYRVNAYDDWVADWDGLESRPDSGMPSHVRLQLKVAGRYWPVIIVAMNQSLP